MTNDKHKRKLMREFFPPASFDLYNKEDHSDFYEDHIPSPGEDEFVNPTALLMRHYHRQRKNALHNLSKLIPNFDESQFVVLDVVPTADDNFSFSPDNLIFLCTYKNNKCAIRPFHNRFELISPLSLDKDITRYTRGISEMEKVFDFLLLK